MGLIGLYLLGHFLLRLMLSPTLGMDDAEQILFAQQWDFGYRFRQPPLFTWMLLPLIDLFGPGVLAISVLRYVLLAITFIFIYLTARLCLSDQRMAGLAALSFPLIYVFGYYAHHDLTHTTALGAMIAITFYAVVKLAHHPKWPAYLMLGFLLGVGLLAKWNFVMLAVGLLLTGLVLPSFRPLILTWKTVLTVIAMAAVITPTALWMLGHDQSIQDVSSDILRGDETISRGNPMLQGGQALLSSTLLFPQPFLLIFLAVFMSALITRRGGAAPPNAKFPGSFFAWLTGITLLLHLPLIPLFDAVNFTERWLHPAMMGLPIALFALVERGLPSPRQVSAYLAIIAILVAAAASARLYRFAAGVDDCGSCREFVPFAAFAQDLRANGFSQGTIVADGMHIGGNLKALFADSRVIDPTFPLALWPDVDPGGTKGDCLLIWRDDEAAAGGQSDMLKAFASRDLDLAVDVPAASGRLVAPLLGSSTRHYSLGFALYQGDTGDCR